MTHYISDEFHEIGDRPASGPGYYAGFGKRMFDVVAVVLSFPIVAPVLLLCFCIALISGGSPIYAQDRIGRRGSVFKCWKIRTMALNADQLLEEHIKSDPAIAQEWQTKQKLRNDPRITRFGRFLRATSLDELPQLWNVLVGDMSVIGPRPFTPNQQALYDAGNSQRAYYDLRPGISGLWQVKSRNDGRFQDRISYDEEYANTLSLKTDAKIAVQTIWVVIKATGK